MLFKILKIIPITTVVWILVESLTYIGKSKYNKELGGNKSKIIIGLSMGIFLLSMFF